jgi:hypothetical protein
MAITKDARQHVPPGRLVGLPSAAPEPTHTSVITALNPSVWFRFDETSGTFANYGTGGSVGTVTGSVDYAQTGQLGSGQAIAPTASPGYVSMTDDAALNDEAFSIYALFNAASVGIGNTLGRLFQWGDHVAFLNGARTLTWEIPRSTTKYTYVPVADQLSGSYPTGWWGIVLSYNAGTANYWQFNGSGVSAVANNTGSVGSGTVTAHGGDLCLLNRPDDEARQGNITLDEFVYFSGTALTLDDVNAIHAQVF